MTNHPFELMAPEFRRRIAAAKITRTHDINKRAAELAKPEVVDRFRPAHDKLGIPLVWMICSFERESGSDFHTSPAQGDRWDRISTHVPRGVGPFASFEAAALWSYHHDGIEQNRYPWTMAYACYAWNLFNGFGPNNHGRVSGYVFAGTDQYDPPRGRAGKYIGDGRWSPDTVDVQLGCLALAVRIIELMPSLVMVPDAETSGVGTNVVTPVPVEIGGGHGPGSAAWVQDSLNMLRVEGTPLVVDNSFGRRTRNAVRAFQRAHGLDTDGLVGKKTRAALVSALAAIPGQA